MIRTSGPAQGSAPQRQRVLRTLARIAATALAGGLLSATMVRFSPGFGLDEKQLDPNLSRQAQEAARRAHDGERNTVSFYVRYLKRMGTGDLGVSASLGRPISELLAERAPLTLELMLWGIGGAWAVAALLAVPASAPRSRYWAVVCSALSGIPASLPAAGIAILLFRVGASARWTITLALVPKLYQYTQSLLRHNYATRAVVLARAKGLSPRRIFFWHVLAPARTQLVALAAVSINMAFGAAVAVEAVCDLPGLGQLAWKAAMARDLPVLLVLTLLVALTTQVANLVADACNPGLRSHA